MKKKTPLHLLQKLAAGACLAVCVACAASAAGSWAQENGEEALLFAAGFQPSGEESLPESASRESVPQESSPQEEEVSQGLTPPDDGVVPFHADELPGAEATPDPDRPTGPVEEITASGGSPLGNFFVRDSTDSGTDLAAELEKDLPVQVKGDGSVEVLIYHTHTSEAYSKDFTGFYYTDMETRTGNTEMNVVAAGEEMKKALEARGIGVVHDITVNDELYNGSYSRSWETIQKNLEAYPTIQVTVDLHRDSMTTQEGVKYKPTATVNGRKAAQAMLLAGCDADGSWGDFPNWEQNLRLILRVQQKASELYPDLMRPLSFSNCKYNMNATPGSMLVEVGTEVNTASEARYTGRLLGEALAETLLEG